MVVAASKPVIAASGCSKAMSLHPSSTSSVRISAFRRSLPALKKSNTRFLDIIAAAGASELPGQPSRSTLEKTADWSLSAATAAVFGISALVAIAPQTAFESTVAAVPAFSTDILLRLTGVNAWPAATILFVLAEAVRHNRLKSDTYQRLAAYVAFGFGIAAVAALGALNQWWTASAISWRNMQALQTGGFALFAIPAVGAAAAIAAGRQDKLSGTFIRERLDATIGAFQKAAAANKDQESTLWQAATFLLPVVIPIFALKAALGTWVWDAGASLSQLGPVHNLLFKVLVLEAVGAGIAALSLKDASDRGRLGGSTFQRLKEAVGAAVAGNVLVYLYASSTAASSLRPVSFVGLAALSVAVVLQWLSFESKRVKA